jgi:hypothetical protein
MRRLRLRIRRPTGPDLAAASMRLCSWIATTTPKRQTPTSHRAENGVEPFILVWDDNAGKNSVYDVENVGGLQFRHHELDVENSGIPRLALSELDTDGDRDLIVAQQSNSSQLVWMENVGGVSPFVASQFIAATSRLGREPIAVGDYNRDRRIHIIFVAGILPYEVHRAVLQADRHFQLEVIRRLDRTPDWYN